MKKTWLLLLLITCLSRLYAQSPLDIRVSIEAEKLPLEQVLYQLIDLNNINLSFSNSILPRNKIVSLKVSNQRLEQVLKQLLEGTALTYEVVGSQVLLLHKKEEPVKRKFTINGYVVDAFTGESIIGAIVYDSQREAGTYTNEFGFFSLTITEGKAHLMVSCLGYKPDSLNINIVSNKAMTFGLKPAFLTEVVVNAEADSIFLETNGPGAITLNVEQITRLASLGGEADVLRTAYTLPGIQTGADGFGGVAVRGGNVDQNLFMLDGVPIYNATHGVGIFSIYNSSAIKSVQLLKGNFPAQYGGRISSVWDIQTKDGNSKYFQGELELGLSSGKLSLEGPLPKEKGSVFFSGRRAFFDFYSIPFTTRLRKKDGVDGYIGYYFYDLNFKINYKLSAKDRIYLSYYRGLDDYTDIYEQSRSFEDTLVFLSDNDKVYWGNDVGAFRWTRQYNGKLFGNTTFTFSRYFYKSQDFVDLEARKGNDRLLRELLLLKYDSDIQDFTLKTDMDYNPNRIHRIRFGASVIKHQFQPGVIFFDQATAIDTIQIDTLGKWNKVPLESLEMDAYVQDEIIIGKVVQANAGLRLSFLAVNEKIHFSPQPRLSLSFFKQQKLSFNLSAARLTQNLHLLSPTSIGLPKDLWVSATGKIPPQQSWQFSSGVNWKPGKGFEADLEGYYKTMKNLLIFRGTLLDEVNSVNWQEMVSTGKGQTYGLEFLLKKQSGKIGGWLAYTLAWTERQFDKEINRGEKFPFRLDRRHSADLQVLYKLNEKWEFAGGYKYASGSAFTFPAQEYELVQAPGHPPSEIITRPIVIDRLNSRRLPAYHKLDFSFNYSFFQRKARHTLTLGVYNAYNRKNPLYITIRDKFTDEGEIKREVVQVSLLPIFPTLRYSLEFR